MSQILKSMIGKKVLISQFDGYTSIKFFDTVEILEVDENGTLFKVVNVSIHSSNDVNDVLYYPHSHNTYILKYHE